MYRRNTNYWWKHWDFIIGDLLIIELSFVLAIILREGFVNPYASELHVDLAYLIGVSDLFVAFFAETYKGIMRRGYYKEFKSTLKHLLYVLFIVLIYLYFGKVSVEFSRISLTLFVIIAFFSKYSFHILWKKHVEKNLKNKKPNMLLVTTSDKAKKIVENLKKSSIQLVGIVLADTDDMVCDEINEVTVVSDMNHIYEYIQNRPIDSVMINVSDMEILPEDFTFNLVGMGLTVHRNLDVQRGTYGDQQLDHIGGYYVISSHLHIASQKQLFFKRLLDIIGSIVGCLFTLIFIITIGPIIYFSDPGPIFFKQKRVGKNGRVFNCYKFRSMYMDAEERKKELMEQNEMDGFMFKMEADPRIIGSGPDGTKHGIGNFIRETSIDEFPQFFNVLKGDMSIVGTRPPTVDEWNQYEPHHRGRMAIKPGITGMWQISGRSNITDFEEIVQLDKDYIENWDVGQDIRMIIKTVGVVFKKEGSK